MVSKRESDYVEKLMQYSVFRTSLTIVLGTATTFETELWRVRRSPRVVTTDCCYEIVQLEGPGCWRLRAYTVDGTPLLGELPRLPYPQESRESSSGRFVRLEWRNVPPETSTVRVFSRDRGHDVSAFAGGVALHVHMA